VLWIVGNFISTEILTETPFIVVNGLFMMVVIFACRLGLETIARSSEILYPWAITGYIILIILVLPNIKVKNLRPMFEAKLISIFHGALLFEAFVPLTLVAFLMVFPASVSNLKEGKKCFYKAITVSGALIIILTTITILALGANWATRTMYPSYALARSIQVANALERIEAIVAMVWIIAIFYKITLYFYGTVTGFAEILGLEDYKAITLPLGIIVVVLSQIIYPSAVYEINWDTTIWIPYVLTNAVLIPLVLLVVGRFKDKKQ
jgi:spore germination protein KB